MPPRSTEQALRDMQELLTGVPGLRVDFSVVLGTPWKQFGVEAARVLLFDRRAAVPNAAVIAEPPEDRCERFTTRYAWPLIAEGRLLGALQVVRRAPVKPDEAWRSAMGVLAVRLAASIAAARRAGTPGAVESPSCN